MIDRPILPVPGTENERCEQTESVNKIYLKVHNI